jgi:hypothetical protein
VCKRCTESLDLGAVVQYVADAVKGGEALDLLLLNEMLGQMTGLQVHSDVSQDQIDVFGCGPVARAECMQAQSATKAEARGSDKQLLKGGRKLMMALQKVKRRRGPGPGPRPGLAGLQNPGHRGLRGAHQRTPLPTISGSPSQPAKRSTPHAPPPRVGPKGPAGHQLALPLLVLIAQQLDYTAITTPSKHLKVGGRGGRLRLESAACGRPSFWALRSTPAPCLPSKLGPIQTHACCGAHAVATNPLMIPSSLPAPSGQTPPPPPTPTPHDPTPSSSRTCLTAWPPPC